MRTAVLMLSLLLLAGCWHVEGEVVPATAGVRIEGVQDGLYRRPDGIAVAVRWNQADRRYDAGDGWVRVQPLAGGLNLAYYHDPMLTLILLAAPKGDNVALFAPTPEAERRLAAKHGLTVKPGPINSLSGPGKAVRAYADELAGLMGSPDMAETGALIYDGPVK